MQAAKAEAPGLTEEEVRCRRPVATKFAVHPFASLYWRSHAALAQVEEIREAFNLFDTDGSGEWRPRCVAHSPSYILTTSNAPQLSRHD